MATEYGYCGWCSKDAVDQVQLRPAMFTGVGVKRRQVKPPFMVGVCKDHENILRRQPKFYTCGCSYVEDCPKCPVHDNKLTLQARKASE